MSHWCSGELGLLSEWGRIAGLPHSSLRMSLEMRTPGFPASLVLSGTVHRGGDRAGAARAITVQGARQAFQHGAL